MMHTIMRGVVQENNLGRRFWTITFIYMTFLLVTKYALRTFLKI